MPLLKLYTLPMPDPIQPPAVLTALAAAIAPILNVKPCQVIAMHIALQPGGYTKGEVAADWHGSDSHPPVLELCAFVGRSDAQIELALTAAAHTLTAQLGLDQGNAFVYHTELQRGRVFTGGAVRK